MFKFNFLLPWNRPYLSSMSGIIRWLVNKNFKFGRESSWRNLRNCYSICFERLRKPQQDSRCEIWTWDMTSMRRVAIYSSTTWLSKKISFQFPEYCNCIHWGVGAVWAIFTAGQGSYFHVERSSIIIKMLIAVVKKFIEATPNSRKYIFFFKTPSCRQGNENFCGLCYWSTKWHFDKNATASVS